MNMGFNVGQRLKELREANNLSVKELSSLSGLSQPYLSQLETNKKPTVPLVTIEKICNSYGITLAEFFNEEIVASDISFNKKRMIKLTQQLTEEQAKNMVQIIEMIIGK